jgi:hypothetical protein
MDFRLPPAAHSVNVNLEDYEVKPSSCLCLSEIKLAGTDDEVRREMA